MKKRFIRVLNYINVKEAMKFLKPFFFISKATTTILHRVFAAWTSRQVVVRTEYHRQLDPRYRRILSNLIRRWGRRRVRPLRMLHLSIPRTRTRKDSISPSTMTLLKNQNRLSEWKERLLKRWVHFWLQINFYILNFTLNYLTSLFVSYSFISNKNFTICIVFLKKEAIIK